ncbi:MAG TPA: carbonic anhydrase [Aridibacter sp.]|nr:carbonic anhydrase [Aridibacter sp.]
MTFSTVDTFGTAINCIDGRAQHPVSEWVRLHANVKYVDVITTPGADGVLSQFKTDRARLMRDEVILSVGRHQSAIVAVAGHFDCLANPCDFEVRKDHILAGAERVKRWDLGVRVVGLYVNEWSSVDVICDTDKDFPQMRSWL